MVRNSQPMNWRKYPERYRLEGAVSLESGQEFFPARIVDPSTGKAEKLAHKEMPREGKIVSWTEVFVGPEGYENETPYFLAIIELPNKVRLLAQVVDSPKEKVKIGARVGKIFRKLQDYDAEGSISYGYKFKVID